MAFKIDRSNSRGSSRGGSFTSSRNASRGGSFKGKSATPAKPAPKPAPAKAQKSMPRPAQQSRTYGTTSNYTSGPIGGYSDPGGSISVTPSEEDYLKGDATYQATISALTKQLQNFNTDINTQRSNRKLDYDTALKDLGYTAGVDGAEGTWNWTDSLTASGRAYQNMLNDFAARGGLQSSGFADSQNDLTRSLNDQFKGIDTANTQFNTDLDRQATRAKDENTAASQAARAEAIMRRAAQYGFGV